MLVETETLIPVQVFTSMVILIALTIALILCMCWKRSQKGKPEVTQAHSSHCSVFLDTETNSKIQTEESGENEAHLEIENGMIPLNTPNASHNGTLHSRGNSVDLSKADRRSGTSTGSSPRPVTFNRELPDIPKQQILDICHHSILPEIPVATDGNFKGAHISISDIPNQTCSPERLRKGCHLHSQLPEIRSTSYKNTSPIIQRHTAELTVSLVNNYMQGTQTHTTPCDEMDDYDHIEEATKKKTRPRSDYDHVVMGGGGNKVVLAKTKKQENDYAEVKTNDAFTQVAEDVMVIPVPHQSSVIQATFDEDVHANSEPKTKCVDPYNRIKEDDTIYIKIKSDLPFNEEKEIERPYNRTKDDPYNRIKVDDPYNTVRDDLDDLDPYNIVNDDSTIARLNERKKIRTMSSKGLLYDPYATVVDEERNVSNQTDPYARVCDTESEQDDPYNKVVDESDSIVTLKTIPDYGDDDYATVNKSGEVECSEIKNDNDNFQTRNQRPLSPREEIVLDEYATVVKVRKLSANNSSAFVCSRVDFSTSSGLSTADSQACRAGPAENMNTPPEPPRDYDDSSSDTDRDHYNTVRPINQGDTSSEQGSKKEPPYNKLSVRESLASMNARSASNTYEYVSEVDNLYATVDGSSGDGIVKARPQQDKREHVGTVINEKNAPAPPSLYSLHETAKQHQDEIRRKTDLKPDYCNIDSGCQNLAKEGGLGKTSKQASQGLSIQSHSRIPFDQDYRRTQLDQMQKSSFEGHVPIATEENVDLECEPNYQAVTESKRSDNISEFDPNYETVDEACARLRYEEIDGSKEKENRGRPHIYEDPDVKRKYEVVTDVPNSDGKVRLHVYEEVKLTNDATRVRHRVLNQHTYEEVTDVKGKESFKDQNGEQLSNNKKTGHERNSSGDWLLFGKKKSGQEKEKSKEKGKTHDVCKK